MSLVTLTDPLEKNLEAPADIPRINCVYSDGGDPTEGWSRAAGKLFATP